jgi:hypothetical protein
VRLEVLLLLLLLLLTAIGLMPGGSVTKIGRTYKKMDIHSKEKVIEKLSEIIGNRTRDLPACSIVPQPTTLPCASRVQLTTEIINN